MADSVLQQLAENKVLKRIDLSPKQGQGQNIGQTNVLNIPLLDHAAEAVDIMNFLKTIRNKHKTLRDSKGSNNQHDAVKQLSEWNDDLLAFCKANRRKYTPEAGETMMIEKERQEDMKVIKHLQEKTTKLEKDLKEALRAKEHALNRLSEVHSRLLKLGNPEIADLSDENRPTNLGRRFKQLYEDDWTDAFEFLTEKRQPRFEDGKAIEMLYEMLKRCRDVCLEGQAAQQSSLTTLVANPSILQKRTVSDKANDKLQPSQGTNVNKRPTISVKPLQQSSGPTKNDFSKTMPSRSGPDSGGDIPKGANKGGTVINKNVQPRTQSPLQMSDVYDVGQMAEPSKSAVDLKKIQDKYDVLFKEFSKGVADETLKYLPMLKILSAINKDGSFQDDVLQNTEIKNYLQKCFNICWLMLAQYPPMLMDFETKAGQTFDSNAFEAYTTKGPTIGQVVWPPVYLHKGGPLVCKGYAEGSKK